MTPQERRIILGLLEHGPLTTGQCWELLRIPTLSQRAGSLERQGLVVRNHVKVNGYSAPVCQAVLTDAGRAVAQQLRDGTYGEEPAPEQVPAVCLGDTDTAGRSVTDQAQTCKPSPARPSPPLPLHMTDVSGQGLMFDPRSAR